MAFFTTQKEYTMKPLLIIGCSKPKLPGTHNAYDLYTGNIYQMINKQVPNVHDHFEVVIFSALHGLIKHDELIESYDVEMHDQNNHEATTNFLNLHFKPSRRLLNSYKNKERDCYVILTNRYLNMFELMFKEDQMHKSFNSCYISRGHKGIGELRGRLNKVLSFVRNSIQPKPPLTFRSGVSNSAELGYIAAGCCIGGSLAHTNTDKKSFFYNELIQTTNHSACFMDNGLVTKARAGEDIDTDWVFSEYAKTIKYLPLRMSRNLFTVVPDDIKCNDNAVNIVRKHKTDILKLTNLTEVILPIHKSNDIESHALRMMHELDYPSNIRLGIPCLEKDDLNLVLPLTDIDRLLSIKNPKRPKEKLFKKVHFFGMSDASYRNKLHPRLLIANLHGIEGNKLSMDACRTPSIFGTNRIGSEIEEAITEQYESPQITKLDSFTKHDYDVECLGDEPIVTQELFDMINEDQVFEFLDIYNRLMKGHPSLQIEVRKQEGIEEVIAYVYQIVSCPDVNRILFVECKNHYWRKFSHLCRNFQTQSRELVRFESIKKVFQKNETAVPVQLALKLSA